MKFILSRGRWLGHGLLLILLLALAALTACRILTFTRE
jgi:hypothetical protein